jgi:hypothetical protein
MHSASKPRPDVLDCGGKRHAAFVRTRVWIASFPSRAGESGAKATAFQTLREINTLGSRASVWSAVALAPLFATFSFQQQPFFHTIAT